MRRFFHGGIVPNQGGPRVEALWLPGVPGKLQATSLFREGQLFSWQAGLAITIIMNFLPLLSFRSKCFDWVLHHAHVFYTPGASLHYLSFISPGIQLETFFALLLKVLLEARHCAEMDRLPLRREAKQDATGRLSVGTSRGAGRRGGVSFPCLASGTRG